MSDTIKDVFPSGRQENERPGIRHDDGVHFDFSHSQTRIAQLERELAAMKDLHRIMQEAAGYLELLINTYNKKKAKPQCPPVPTST